MTSKRQVASRDCSIVGQKVSSSTTLTEIATLSFHVPFIGIGEVGLLSGKHIRNVTLTLLHHKAPQVR